MSRSYRVAPCSGAVWLGRRGWRPDRAVIDRAAGGRLLCVPAGAARGLAMRYDRLITMVPSPVRTRSNRPPPLSVLRRV